MRDSHERPMPRTARTVLTALLPPSRGTAANITAFIQALYRVSLHRPATPSEMSASVQMLEARGRSALVKSLMQSDDALERQIQTFYSNLVGRSATRGEIIEATALIRCGHSLDKLMAMIVCGDEYAASAAQRYTQLDEGRALVTAAYADLLQRTCSDDEMDAALDKLAPGKRDGFVLPLIRSTEYRANFIDDLYSQLLHRNALPSEILPWTQRGHQALDLQKARLALLSSDEFFYRWS